jgi:hypothetical protein
LLAGADEVQGSIVAQFRDELQATLPIICNALLLSKWPYSKPSVDRFGF